MLGNDIKIGKSVVGTTARDHKARLVEKPRGTSLSSLRSPLISIATGPVQPIIVPGFGCLLLGYTVLQKRSDERDESLFFR